jgi:probable phosphoglycerate mutase
LIVYGDGGSRGNPGEAAYGFAIFENGKLLFSEGKRLGITTNNVAEYSSVTNALEWIKNNRPQTTFIEFYLDSLLVASQLSGRYKIKHPSMKELYAKTKTLESKLSAKISYSQVPREQNKIADRLVNDALDFII